MQENYLSRIKKQTKTEAQDFFILATLLIHASDQFKTDAEYIFGKKFGINDCYKHCCGSGFVFILGHPGSGSFYHKIKIVRKTLIPMIPTVMRHLYDFLSLQNDVNVPSKCNKQKNKFFVAVLTVIGENSKIQRKIQSRIRIRGSRSGSESKFHGSATLVKRLIKNLKQL